MLYQVLLVGLAFGLRVIYLSQVRDNPFFLDPIMDAAVHLEWAQRILDGNLLGSDAFFRAPLYPYLLALLQAISGGDLFAVRLLQHVIGVVGVWGIYRLARHLHSESAAKIAGLGAAVYLPLIYFENELLLDFLLVPGMLLIGYTAYRYHRNPSSRAVLFLGGATGLFAITRPNILLCVPVIIIAVWLWARQVNLTRRTMMVGILLVGLLIPILPVTLHNAIVGDDFVLISSQGGINFYVGNNAEADGLSAAMPEPWGHTWTMADVHHHAEETVGEELKPSGASWFWLQKGLQWWEDNPGEATALLWKKAVLLLTNTEVANNQNIRHFHDQYAPLARWLPLSFGIVAPLGLIGLLLAARDNRVARLLLWLMVVYAISVIIFFVPARFRLPLVPLLFIGFGVFLWKLVRSLARRKIHSFVIPAIAAGLFMVVAFGNWYPTQPATDVQAIFQLGNAALRKGNLTEAEEYFQQVLSLDPNYRAVHLNLGVVHLRRGHPASAQREFEEELKVNPNSDRAYANLSSVYALQGRRIEAARAGEKALEINPNNPTARFNLSNVRWSEGRFKDALRILLEGPDYIQESPLGRSALGATYLKMERFAEAESVLLPLANGEVQLDPTGQLGFDIEDAREQLGFNDLTNLQARANYNLGWMTARQGDRAASLPYFRKAVALNSQFDEALANIGSAFLDGGRPDSALHYFTRAAEINSKNPGYPLNIGLAYLELADTTRAMQHIEQALEINPQFSPARQKMIELKTANKARVRPLDPG